MLRALRSISSLHNHHRPCFLTHYTDSLSSIHILSTLPQAPTPKTVNSKHEDLTLEIFYLVSEINVVLNVIHVKSHQKDHHHNSNLSWQALESIRCDARAKRHHPDPLLSPPSFTRNRPRTLRMCLHHPSSFVSSSYYQHLWYQQGKKYGERKTDGQTGSLH